MQLRIHAVAKYIYPLSCHWRVSEDLQGIPQQNSAGRESDIDQCLTPEYGSYQSHAFRNFT